MKIMFNTWVGLILVLSVAQAQAALIHIDGINEGRGSGPVGTIGETMDYLKFEVLSPSVVSITGTDLSASRLLMLGTYMDREDQFGYLGNPYTLMDNYPSPGLPVLERTLDSGIYIVAVSSTEDSEYEIVDGFVAINLIGGYYSIAPYSFEISGDVRPLEFWEGKHDPAPYGSFDITYYDIPEPSSVLLLAVGSGGLLFHRRTKQRRQEQHLSRKNV